MPLLPISVFGLLHADINPSNIPFLERVKFPFLDLQSRLCMLLDAARGADFVHSKGIVHNDFKSLNLLLSTE
jgi:serine/threonine protein kinase